MKIRTDFVTNSSSSSFVLSFKDEDSIYETVRGQFPKWCAKNLMYKLLEDIEDAKRLSKEIVADEIDEELFYSVYWDLENRKEFRHMSFEERDEYFRHGEGKKLIDQRLKEIKDNTMKKIGDDKVIVEVEYGDDNGEEDGILEHDILPRLGCTAIVFSHH